MNTTLLNTHRHPATQRRGRRPEAAGARPFQQSSGRTPELDLDMAGARLLRIDEVCYAVGLSASQVYQLVAEKAFPAQIKMSKRCSRWRARDVLQWLEDLQ